MALIDLIEKGADADLVREMLTFAAERLMEHEVGARAGGLPLPEAPASGDPKNGADHSAEDSGVSRMTSRGHSIIYNGASSISLCITNSKPAPADRIAARRIGRSSARADAGYSTDATNSFDILTQRERQKPPSRSEKPNGQR